MEYFERDVAQGVHRISSAYVNCYLIEDGREFTLVDSGLPASWLSIRMALAQLGRAAQAIRAVVLTHAHFDHLGSAARLRTELDVPVWAHPGDHSLASHPYRYARERSPLAYPFRYPQGVRIQAGMVRAGALRVPAVRGLRTMVPDSALDVPGRPQVIFTPGHTAGHCALLLADRDAVITGDALVTLDPYTGRTGPQIVARAATADSRQAKDSLSALAATNVAVALPGHGEPWTSGISTAVEKARGRPVS